MTQSLLDFILGLLRDSDAKAAFLADPSRALADAGLSDVCSEDVADAMSYVAEYHPVSFVGEREYNVANHAVSQHASTHDDHHDDDHGERHGGPGDWQGDPHAGVVARLEYITNNYAYTDSHDTVIDHSVNQSIWNEGVLAQSFDDHSVTATDHSVAAGRDIEGDTVTGDHNVVGHGNSVGNTSHWDDHSVDNSIQDSFNGNNLADHGGVAGDGATGNVTNPEDSAVATTGAEVDASSRDSHDRSIEDSFNDSHNQHNTTHTDINSHNEDYHPTHATYETTDSYNTHSGNHDNNNHQSYNEDSANTHTEQHGLINANLSPAVNLPIHDNDLDILSPEAG